MINLTALKAEHKKFIASHERMVDEVLEASGQFAKSHVQKYSTFRRRSANSLKDATEYKVIRLSSGRVVRIKSRKKYAAAIDRGARPHVIRARRAKTLRFQGRGGLVFRRSVNHPGNKPYRFLWKATNAAFRDSQRRMQLRMALLARKF